MRVFRMLCLLAAFVFVPGAVIAQQQRIDSPTVASPRGSASTQVGGVFNAAGAYQGGAWIVVDYGRPILRGRQGLFGAGETYGDDFLVGAPIWRLQRFADLEEDAWTLVFSTWGVKEAFQEDNADALWGAYEYTPERDVLRTRMSVRTLPVSADQLVITFTDMTQEGGNFSVWWDDQLATAPFTVAR